MFRHKLDTSVLKPCRIWAFDHSSKHVFKHLVISDLVPLSIVKTMWLSRNQCGLVCEFTDLMVREQDVSCPFD